VDDVLGKLDEITEMVESARSMPMSASALVHRADMLKALDELRELLPDALREAQWVIKDREEVVAAGRKEAERIIADGKAEATRLVGKTEIMTAARAQADALLADTREEARTMRLDAEEYVDTKLANFEVVLHKTIQAVERGRDKLRGRIEHDSLSEDQLAMADEDEAPLLSD
jgi:vacuolar-type H+-ATPase subunit H